MVSGHSSIGITPLALRLHATVFQIDLRMAKSEEIDLQVAFAKPGAKRRFRKLVGVNEITEEEVEEMVAGNDSSYFLECLQSAGQPVYEVSWGALWHGGSGKFELYYFDGQYFTTNDYTREVAGPFKKCDGSGRGKRGSI